MGVCGGERRESLLYDAERVKDDEKRLGVYAERLRVAVHSL